MDMTKMGIFLQALRREQGLTQEQLGETLHISSKTISRWETGTYMPPVEMLLALSELYGVSMNELVAGERLTPETLPTKAEENLTAAMKDSVSFQLEERKTYWKKKWQHEHRWSLALLIILHGIVQIIGNLLDQLWINVGAAIVTIALAILYRNRMDNYVEHHLYDEMLDQ